MNPLLSAFLAFVLSIGVTKEDVLRLLNAGVSESTLVDYIRSNGPAEPLSVEDLTELRNAGASDAVLRAMLDTSRTADAVTPSHPPAESRSTTYTYSDPPIGSYAYPSSNFYYYYPYPRYYNRPYYYYPYSYYRYPFYRYPSTAYPRYARPYPSSLSPYRVQRPPVQSRPQQANPPRHGVGPYRR